MKPGEKSSAMARPERLTGIGVRETHRTFCAGIVVTSIETRLRSLGIDLPNPPLPGANYVSFKRFGDVLHISGRGGRNDQGAPLVGKVGADSVHRGGV